jgi:virulence-associated protein VapD
MFAISFDLVISLLQEHYGDPYHRAYYEVKNLLERHEFEWIQGSTYITQSDNLGTLYKAINSLSKIEWFKKSVRDIRGFKVENWSDFTTIVKNS